MSASGQYGLNGNIQKSLILLKNDITDLYLPKSVPVISEIPDSFKFFRNWVAPNIPVLIKGGIKNWNAYKKWNEEYICEKLKNKKVSVAVTPNGYADALTETIVNGAPMELFVIPEERSITIGDFFSKLEDSSVCKDALVKESKGVFYIQKQNSNLIEEFSELLPDIDENLPWASDSFQGKPTAINLWIGDERAVTSLHKDPFENIYCVVSGHKDFILLPPTDRPWLPYKRVPVGQYKETSPGIFEINLFHSDKWMIKQYDKNSDVTSLGSDVETDRVPWIALDPTRPDFEKYPLYKNATPMKVRVEEGDMFYMPSLWFHHVTQSHKCIAINYWYDMSLDIKFAYFQLLENLANSFEDDI